MAAEVKSLTYAVGRTIWDQPLILTHERHYTGRWHWTLKQEASSQRDEETRISGLTDDAILAMADAVRARTGR